MNSAAGMLCPSCRVSLIMSERSGIEIDYCPQCRGIWLDRGELDKIIERSIRDSAPASSQQPMQEPGYAQSSQQQPQQNYAQGHQQSYQQHGYDQHYGHKRKKSFLEQLFD
ncbi:TFIIB-type zinc ribbon-containing protein [Rhizobium sp.]